jgi:signal transduction histidine kinase
VSDSASGESGIGTGDTAALLPEPPALLVVEDSRVDRLLVERSLRRSSLGYEVVATDDLESAYVALDREAFAAAVVDWSLPDGSVLDFLTRVDLLQLRLPVVVLTGHGDDERARQALERGAQDYLVKGQHGPEALVRSIRYAIERKRAEDFRARLLHADRLVSLGNLAAGISHELNNPMSWLLANMEFIDENLRRMRALVTDEDEIKETLRDTLGLVSESSTGLHRIARTVRALKDYARLSPDRTHPVHINDILKSAARIAAPAVQHRAEVTMELAEDLPPVDGDEVRLEQVFTNLLLNAAQAIDNAPPNPTGHTHGILARSRRKGERVVVSIEDSGPGVPASLREQIFSPFFTTKAESKGSGLGLPICRDILAHHRGQITVGTSGRLGGAEFRVTLPIGVPGLEIGTEPPSRSHSDASRPEVHNVLVIDDEESVGRVMARLLRPADVVLVTSAAGARAALAQRTDFDFVICDLMMRPESGADLVTWLRAAHPELADRVILCTGGAVTPSLRRFQAESGLPVLSKPFSRDEMWDALRRSARGSGRDAAR